MTDLPPHGPGCLPTIGVNARDPGEPRYICAANCPRQRALYALDLGREPEPLRPKRRHEPEPGQRSLF